ncbi:hypothetical protein QFC22_006171 [Naganishia vaughanmartiniae]|uniref:Uncharacterized protein n=1 Tax=Naganishia vaughanmartiniae TaxID=1424756 RepID=A0ACC2WN85_9TREE|nr:hypothetical protein QFC22_006171 [Naganishia vaughanmartiniae]
MSSQIVFLLTLSVFSALLAHAAPTLVLPVADQLPVIARVNKDYEFKLLYNTFTTTSTTSNMTYAATGLPTWLSFDNTTLSFSGIPKAKDVGSLDVTLSATDTSSTSTTFSILVTNDPSPAIHQGFDTQIGSPELHQFNTAQALPSHQGVYIHPYYSFSLGFQQSTFRPAYNAPSQSVYYSAHLRGLTTLPSWLNFDNETVTFSGTAPSEGSFTVVVTGSDVWGYTAIENSFVIEVGTAYIDVKEDGQLANVTTTAGSAVRAVLDLSLVSVNGKTGDVDVKADLKEFPWLSFDSSTSTLSGTTPASYINASTTNYIPITLSAVVNGSTATLTEYIPVTIVPSLFTAVTLSDATAQPGNKFSYPIDKYFKNSSAVRSVNATFSGANGNLTSWLTLDPESYTLTGNVPNSSYLTRKDFRSLAVGDTQVSVILAAMDLNSIASTATFGIDIAGIAASAVTTSSATATAAATKAVPASPHKSGLSNGAKLGLGLGLGLGGAILLALLAFCCFRRRKSRAAKQKQPPPRRSTDGDSFVGMIKSPRTKQDPFGVLTSDNGIPRSHSARLDQGEVPTFSSIYLQRPSENGDRPTRVEIEKDVSQPQRMAAMNGILNWGAQEKLESGLGFPPTSAVNSPDRGEIIRQDSLNVPSNGGSDFTYDFTTSESRASWESRGSSFQWSSGEGRLTPDANGRPISGAPSIPRPRPDFAPRYPRHNGSGAMARLVRPPSDSMSGHTFSEFDHSSPTSPDSLSGSNPTTSFGSRIHTSSGSNLSLSPDSVHRPPAGFSTGPSGLGRIIDSNRFSSVDEEDENSQNGSAQEHAPYDHGEQHGELRLMPSRERFAVSPTHDEMPIVARTPSQEAAITESPAEAFDDADEEAKRESTAYAPSQLGDLQALGYPADSIVFGSPPMDNRASLPAGKRVSSIRAVPPQDKAVMSPPMPMGNMLQHTLDRNRQTSDGRYMATINDTFKLHPALNPPPSVSLSAATWTAQAPSTYRAERADGTPLPPWLRWDTKEFTLWGIPPASEVGDVIEVKIVESIPKEKKKQYDSSVWQATQPNERQVGYVVIQVNDGVKSPDAFDLEAWGRV